MNWSVWDTLFIIVGVIGLVATALMWRFSSLLTRVLGLIFGGFLVLFGVVAGLQMEWTYPLPLLALPLVPILLALVVDLPKHQRGAAVAAPAAAPVAANSMTPPPMQAATTPAQSKLDDAPQEGPDATHEDIDAALADWYFDPAAGRTKRDGGEKADEIEWDAPAATTSQDAERELPSGHHAGPVADFGDGYELAADGAADVEEDGSISYPAGAPASVTRTSADEPVQRESAEDVVSAYESNVDEWAPEEGPDAESVLDVDGAPSHGFTREQAMDPATPAATLHEIAAAAPELHAALASNPSLYPSLREWLASSPEQDVQDALAKNPAK